MDTESKATLKKLAIHVLSRRPLTRMLGGSLKGRCAIFMLHRFDSVDRGVRGHDPTKLRDTLAKLRRDRQEIISLREVFARLDNDGAPLDGEVCFTIDDGYAEHAEIAAPIFAEFDVPVTIFVSTGFIDAAIWYWWDQAEYILTETTRRRGQLETDHGRMALMLAEPGDRAREVARVVEYCKGFGPEAVAEIIARLSVALDVEVPRIAPPKYAPMTWEGVRVWEQRGLRFGPHGVRHPILPRCSDEQVRDEVGGSWARLRAMAADPDPVFCYPNGQPGDFGPREFEILKQVGIVGAVTGRQTYAAVSDFRADPFYRFGLPRFVYFDDLRAMAQVLSGLVRTKERLRGGPP